MKKNLLYNFLSFHDNVLKVIRNIFDKIGNENVYQACKIIQINY